jgi:hypothetical protein
MQSHSSRAAGAKVRDILHELDLGNSVAEHDEALERYFVETETFRSLISDQGDIIAGDKGTGKTALYKILRQRYTTLPELRNVEVLPGFNPVGNPVFQRLSEANLSNEGEYVTVWKAYVLSLVGNWVLQLNEDVFTDSMRELDELLKKVGLRSVDDSAGTIFSAIVNLFRRLTNPKAAEVAVSVSPQGLPLVVPRMEFESPSQAVDHEPHLIRHEEALALLNRVLEEIDLKVWLVLDRLDEAFQGFPAVEVPALRALLRAYLDMLEFPQIRLKLFVRHDLFRKVTQAGFVNLTHVNDRKIPIVWEDADLFDLLRRRFAENSQFMAHLGTTGGSGDEIFAAIFPEQVDMAQRKPKTWKWMTSRIRDGNNVKPPRNLIDLVKKAQAAQLRAEQRSSTQFVPGAPIISGDSLKSGLAALSKERVEDTLLAEAGEYASTIERFRDGKAEHNEQTIASLLGLSQAETRNVIKALMEIGFLEQVGSSYKIPMLYRQGLGVTQGKAFPTPSGTEAESGDDDE